MPGAFLLVLGSRRHSSQWSGWRKTRVQTHKNLKPLHLRNCQVSNHNIHRLGFQSLYGLFTVLSDQDVEVRLGEAFRMSTKN